MDHIEKFLCKLHLRQAQKLIVVLEKIGRDDCGRLDITAMKGKKGWFRCRVGVFRIIFVKSAAGTNMVIDVDFRGRIYKKQRKKR